MRHHAGQPGHPGRLQLSPLIEKRLRLPLLAGLGVFVVLVHGALTRQAPSLPATVERPAPTPAPTPPTTLPSLRPNLDSLPLRYQSDYWQQLGERVRRRLVAIGSQSLTGVMVAPGVALTTLAAVAGVPEDGVTPHDETLLGFDEDLGVALFELPEGTAPPPFVIAPPETLRPGALLSAVSLGRDQRLRVAPGVLVSSPAVLAFDSPLDVQLEFPGDFGAAAVVDLEGRLTGFAVSRDTGETHVFPAPLLTLLTSHLRNRRFCQAIEVADLSASVKAIAGVDGVFVERVRSEAFVPEPSLHAGDVLLAWNGEPVERADAFRVQYESTPAGERVRFRVRRGRGTVHGVTVMPDRLCRPVGLPPLELPALGLTLRWVRGGGSASSGEAGWRVQTVDDASARGIEPGDWLVQLDGHSLASRNSATLLENLDRRPRPAVVTIRRGAAYRMRALTPGEEPQG